MKLRPRGLQVVVTVVLGEVMSTFAASLAIWQTIYRSRPSALVAGFVFVVAGNVGLLLWAFVSEVRIGDEELTVRTMVGTEVSWPLSEVGDAVWRPRHGRLVAEDGRTLKNLSGAWTEHSVNEIANQIWIVKSGGKTKEA